MAMEVRWKGWYAGPYATKRSFSNYEKRYDKKTQGNEWFKKYGKKNFSKKGTFNNKKAWDYKRFKSFINAYRQVLKEQQKASK